MIQTGLSRLVADGSPLLTGRRVGLICNPTAVDRELRHAADLLELAALFGPSSPTARGATATTTHR